MVYDQTAVFKFNVCVQKLVDFEKLVCTVDMRLAFLFFFFKSTYLNLTYSSKTHARADKKVETETMENYNSHIVDVCARYCIGNHLVHIAVEHSTAIL